MKVLLIDNYDSFTYMLADYFLSENIKVDVIRNDKIEINEDLLSDYVGVILSPGPGIPKSAGNLMCILDFFIKTNKPILGICLGHQAIGEYFGSPLVKANYPMHGKTSFISHKAEGIFEHLPEKFKVMRYHSLILENCELPLKVIASTDDFEIMAIKHIDNPIYGLQFHPESEMSEFGHQIIKNWIGFLN